MKWEGHQESGNIEDRRGLNKKTVALGGGAALIVLIIGTLLGVDPQRLNELIGNRPLDPKDGNGAVAERPLTPQEERSRKFAATILRFTEEVWEEQFRRVDKRYQPPHMVLFSDRVQTGCGAAPSAVGPFYCPGDSTVYLDLAFFDQMEHQLGAGGAFAQAFVIAHELGHHVQAITGTSGQVQQLQARNPHAANKLSIMTELQADCYAGTWAHSTYQRGLIGPEEIDQAINAAGAIGDDNLQRAAVGRIDPAQWTHGSSAQRQHWLTTGYDTGDTASCNTFATAR